MTKIHNAVEIPSFAFSHVHREPQRTCLFCSEIKRPMVRSGMQEFGSVTLAHLSRTVCKCSDRTSYRATRTSHCLLKHISVSISYMELNIFQFLFLLLCVLSVGKSGGNRDRKNGPSGNESVAWRASFVHNESLITDTPLVDPLIVEPSYTPKKSQGLCPQTFIEKHYAEL